MFNLGDYILRGKLTSWIMARKVWTTLQKREKATKKTLEFTAENFLFSFEWSFDTYIAQSRFSLGKFSHSSRYNLPMPGLCSERAESQTGS